MGFVRSCPSAMELSGTIRWGFTTARTPPHSLECGVTCIFFDRQSFSRRLLEPRGSCLPSSEVWRLGLEQRRIARGELNHNESSGILVQPSYIMRWRGALLGRT